MSDFHLGPGTAYLLLAHLPAEQREVLAHVLGCGPCQRLVTLLLEQPAPAAAAEPAATAVAAADLPPKVAAAAPLVEELLDVPAGQRRARVAAEDRFQTVQVAYLLVDQAREAAAEAPVEAETLARLGLFVTARLREGRAPRAVVASIEAQGSSVLSYVSARQGDWPGMREALEQTHRALGEGRQVVEQPLPHRLLAAATMTEQQIKEDFAVAIGACELLMRIGGFPRPPRRPKGDRT